MTTAGSGHASGKPPRVRVVRAGQHGQDEEAALDEGMAIVGFQEFGGFKQTVVREARQKSFKIRFWDQERPG